MRVEVEGVASVQRGLHEIAAYLDHPDDAFEAIGKEAARVASGKAPRRTGTLAGDLRSELIPGGTVLTTGDAALQYAGPINSGVPAKNIAPTRYLDETAEEMESKAPALFEDRLDEHIRKAGLA